MRRESKSIRILGIDPGVERTGIGIIDVNGQTPQLVFVDCITTPKSEKHEERIMQVKQQLLKIIQQYKPDRSAVEKLFFSQNVKTAMSVSEARGVILVTLKEAGLPISEWTPQQIKQSVTGYGNADKLQVQKLVCAILKLKTVPKPDDATDALAVALTAQQLMIPA